LIGGLAAGAPSHGTTGTMVNPALLGPDLGMGKFGRNLYAQSYHRLQSGLEKPRFSEKVCGFLVFYRFLCF